MVSSLGFFVSQRARNIYVGMSAVVASAGYFSSGVLASTTVRVAIAFASYCPNHGEPVSTPLGSMTCNELSRLVADQAIILPILSWTVPVAASAVSAFVVYRVATANRFKPLTPEVQATQPSITGSCTSGGEYDFYTARSHFSGSDN